MTRVTTAAMALTIALMAGTTATAHASAGTATLWGAGCGLMAAEASAGMDGLPAANAAGARGLLREPADIAVGDEVPAGAGQAPSNYTRTIPVYFHVITAGSGAEQGNVSQAQIASQISVLNQAFSGGYGGVRTPFSFALAGVTRTLSAEWFSMGYHSPAERRAKSALRQGGADALNIYSTSGGGVLGWATFPAQYSEKSRATQALMDGIVVHFGSLPGGFIENFNLGHTATHEAGHWLGLYHTFQNGCSNHGDQVADTPQQRVPSSGCPEGKDTCAGPGLDAIHNYMDYSDDPCYTGFTQGQSDRATAQFVHFRGG